MDSHSVEDARFLWRVISESLLRTQFSDSLRQDLESSGFGGTQRLARLVGMGRAKEMIFTCDNVDAAEAYRIGLVNKVVAKEELMPTAKAMAAKIISKGSYAISVAKAAINNGYDMDIKNAVEMEANLFGVVNDTNDKKEGMGAFLEKRAANLTDF